FDWDFRISGKEQIFLFRTQAERGSGLPPFRGLKNFEIHFMRDDMNVRLFQLPRHFPRLNNRGVHLLRQPLASRGSNKAPESLFAALVDGSEQIVAVIGDHDGNSPLRAGNQTDVAKMRVHEVKRTLPETLPQLENRFRVKQ